MLQLVEYPLEGGGSILIEAADTKPVSGITRAKREGIPEKAIITFEEALDKIKPTAASIIGKFRDLNDKPDEVSVEFGLKLTTNANIIVTSGGIEANFKVTLTWKKE
jgi:hypothetical protein